MCDEKLIRLKEMEDVDREGKAQIKRQRKEEGTRVAWK
jgi:hypothetical protein